VPTCALILLVQVRVLGKEVKDLEQRNADLKTKLAAAEAFAMVRGSRRARTGQM
jgi:hypothetical protein